MTNDELLYKISVDQKALLKQLSNVEKSFNSTFDDIDKNAKNMNIVGSILSADALKAGLSTAKDLIVSGIKKIVQETSQLQDATLDWEMLTGSAELAGKKIEEVYDFANRTPFDTKEVNTAATNLYKVSQGALGATEDLVRLGDAAKKGQVPIVELSTTYGRLYNKLTNGEKAFADEINRMTDLGLVTFKTKQALQSMDAQLLKTEGIKLLNADLDKANGTMERFSQNISGKLGTLSSEWDQLFAFDEPTVTESITSTIDVLINTLKDNKGEIQSVLTDVFSITTTFVDDWVRGALSIYDLFSRSQDYTSYQTQRGLINNAITTQYNSSIKTQEDANKLMDRLTASLLLINDEMKGAKEVAGKNSSMSISLTEGLKSWWDSSPVMKMSLPSSFLSLMKGSIKTYSLTGDETLEELMAIKETISEGNIDVGEAFNTDLDRLITAYQDQNTILDKIAILNDKKTALSTEDVVNITSGSDDDDIEKATDVVKKQYMDYIDIIKSENGKIHLDKLTLYNSEMDYLKNILKTFVSGTYQDIIENTLKRESPIVPDSFYSDLFKKAPNLMNETQNYDEKYFGGKDPQKAYEKFNKNLGRSEDTYVDNINKPFYEKIFALESEDDKLNKLSKEYSVKLQKRDFPLEDYYTALRNMLFAQENNRIVNQRINEINFNAKSDTNLLSSQYKNDEISKEQYEQKTGSVIRKRDEDVLKEQDKAVNILDEGVNILNDMTNEISLNSAENAYNIEQSMEKFNETVDDWANKNNIINSFVNPTVSIMSAWKNDSLNIFSKLSSTSGGIASGVSGLMDSGLISKTGNIASLIGGLTGFGSIIGGVGSLVDLFSNDSDDEDVNDTYATNNSKTADIVSTAVDTIIVNANMSVYTTYVDEAGFDQMFSEQIAPRFAELVQGVY